jgi:hypothetical protein
MLKLSRWSVLRGSAGLAAGALMRPYIANAAATSASVWWTQGFCPGRGHRNQEDIRRLSKSERQHTRLRHHSLCAEPAEDRLGMTTGVVTELFQDNPAGIITLFALNDKLVDVTDVVETQREEYTETDLLSENC